MNLEEDLRATLHERAAAAMPPTNDLMTNINLGVRRDVRRRRLVAGGAAVLAVVTALAVPMIVRGGDVRPRPMPATSLPPSPAPSEEWDGPTTPSASFSLMPGWAPTGLGAGKVLQLGPNELLQFERAGRVLSVEVGPLQPDRGEDTEEEHTADVGGRRATVRTLVGYDGAKRGDRFIGVSWRTPETGLWVQVLSWGPLTEAEVLRFARGLSQRDGAVASGPALLDFAEVPPGRFVTQFFSRSTVCFAPGGQRYPTRLPEGLCVELLNEPSEPLGAGESLTVRGEKAALDMEGGSMTVDLSADRHLAIRWDTEKLPFSRADILRFATGITLHRQQ
ncbi:hypothetical protein AB0G04_06855 [Actinoplanes sp. NPDC023801]|uniref:hypothetical protein n=1 Tax=Actinoplanes sp. NPDC023801 TaxID=3154595 RepID=UPI0033CB62B2